MKINQCIFFLLLGNLLANVSDYVSTINEYLTNAKYQDAADVFDKALLDYDSSSELYYVGAQISIKFDDLDQANKYFVKAIELDSKNTKYRNDQQKLAELKGALTRARKTFDSGLLDDAIIEYEKLTDKYPEHAIVFYNLGLIYKITNAYDLAVKNYQKSQILNPFVEKYSIAITAIAQISAKEGDEEYRRQEFDSAIDKYLKAISYHPKYIMAFFKLARTYYKLKDFDNARLYLEKGLQIDPKQEQSEKMLGDIYRRADEMKLAIIHYNKAIEINENYYQAFYSLGSLYLSSGEFIRARDAIKTAIMIEPTYSKAYGALGMIEQELDSIDSAIMNYSKAVDYDTRAYDIYYRLSSVYNINKQYEEAKKSAKKSLNIKQNYAPAYFELGIAEKSLNNRIAAKDAFEKAKKDRNWRKSAQFELDLLSKGL